MLLGKVEGAPGPDAVSLCQVAVQDTDPVRQLRRLQLGHRPQGHSRGDYITGWRPGVGKRGQLLPTDLQLRLDLLPEGAEELLHLHLQASSLEGAPDVVSRCLVPFRTDGPGANPHAKTLKVLHSRCFYVVHYVLSFPAIICSNILLLSSS